jgi:Secretion system C-terminal sorting domain
MKLFPNPATNSITLDDGDNINQELDFEIFDTTGKKV